MARTLAEVFVSVKPDTSGFGSALRRDLGRDTSMGRVGAEHGHHYGSAVVKGATAPIRGGFGLLWRGVAAGAAAVGVGRILGDSVKGFRDHQKTVAQTAAVLKSTGNAAHSSVGAIGKLSDALERKSTVDGDVIQSGANMLATFTNVQNRVGKGNDIFNRATSTVLDMSVALGQDAPSSAIQLGKALNDPVKGITALQRVGVTFNDQQRKQIDGMVKAGNVAGAQKVILAELNKEFGGSAAAQGKAAGAAGRLQVAYRQAQDTIGSALLPVVNQLEGALADRLPGAADKAAKAIPRITAGAQGLYDLIVRGDFTGKFGKAFHLEEDSATVDRILTIRDGVIGLAEKLKTVDFHTLAQQAGDLAGKLKGVNFTALFDQAKNINTAQIGAGFTVAGAGVKFLADHIGLLVAALPVLISLFAAYKATQAAQNVVDVASIPLKVAQVGSNILLARSIKSLAASQTEQTGAQIVNTAVTGAGSAAMGVSRIRTLAATAAQIVAKVATLAWAGAQAVLNAVLTANPIGLVIAAVALLTAGIIYAYKHSETFRRIVDGAFHAIATAGQWMWDKVLRPVFKFIVDTWLIVAGAIVHGAARAFGWVPGLGPKLKAAAGEFDKFRDSINASLSGVRDRTVSVTARLKELGITPRTTAGLASGGVVPFVTDGPRAIVGEGNPSYPEYVIPTDPAHRARALKLYGELGAKMYAAGGRLGHRGIVISPRLEGKDQFDAALAAFDRRLGAVAARLAKLGAGGAGLLPFMRAHAGNPYVWGGVGPNGFDCSGWISALVNVARGRSPYHRLFSTETLPAGMFASGPGRFTIGWMTGRESSSGIGHMAATIGGVATESRGGDGVVTGARSAGAYYNYFRHHAHLMNFARGGVLPGDPPFDQLDRRGRYYEPGLVDALLGVKQLDRGGYLPPRSTTLVRNGTSQWEPVGPPGPRGPLLNVENLHMHDGVDADLLAGKLGFLERAGQFG